MQVLSLYQTSLGSIQALPKTVHTLETLSPLIESAFNGRNDKPGTVAESFKDFWETTYADMPMPKDSWPAGIQTCLDFIYPLAILPANKTMDDDALPPSNDKRPAAHEGAPVVGDEGLFFPHSDEDTDLQSNSAVGLAEKLLAEASQSSNVSPFFGNLGPAFFTPALPTSMEQTRSSAGPLPGFKILEPPTTPTRARASTSSKSSLPPTQPSASGTISQPLFSTIPTTPSTPKRTIVSELVYSPSASSKRKRISQEKENLTPIASVVDRIALVLNSSPNKYSTLGKRRAAQDWQEGSVLKKRRATTAGSDSEDERLVETALLSYTPSTSRTSLTSNHPKSSTDLPSKKRKGVFMDAVELPTLREVQKGWKKLRKTQSSLDSTNTPSTPPKRSLVRSKSLDQSTVLVDEGQARKRRRRGVNPKTRGSFLSSPLRTLENTRIIADSDDSIALEQTSREQERSDDDPHLGQVTPHRLISPALRRIQHLDSDTPSDDSAMSVSPTRDVTTRRLRRSSSASSSSYLKPSPFNFRMSRVSLIPAFLSK